ncbi:11839_t:CDS:2, partial [Entrophospora sp. SA101]
MNERNDGTLTYLSNKREKNIDLTGAEVKKVDPDSKEKTVEKEKPEEKEKTVEKEKTEEEKKPEDKPEEEKSAEKEKI